MSINILTTDTTLKNGRIIKKIEPEDLIGRLNRNNPHHQEVLDELDKIIKKKNAERLKSALKI